MKKTLKKLLIILMFLIVPMLTACNTVTVTSIKKTDTVGNVDTYTIYYSDGTTSTFDVNNGQKTIIDIKKTSSEGLVDTYTITYSDNSTSDFKVTNGKNGIDGIDGENATDITITDMYNEWKATTNALDTSFDAFLRNYLTVEDAEDTTKVISKTITSAVSINTVFNYTSKSRYGSTTQETASAGSGVIISMSEEDKANGNCIILTNYHVVYDSTSNEKISKDIRIYLYGLENSTHVINATYIGGSMAHDVAVLKVTNSDVLKNSIATQCQISQKGMVLGQSVIAIGNPEGDGLSATKGICSVENEQITMTLSDNLTEGTLREIRIDAAVNPGNSGGGLFNMKGELVGIVNAKLIDSKIDCVGYALPIETVYAVYNKILATCDGETVTTPKFAKLGLSCYTLGYESYYDYDTESVKTREYIIVKEAIEGGISKTLGDEGFKAKDIIVSAKFDGKVYNFEKMYELSNFLLLLDENSTIVVTVKRVVIPENNEPESEGYIDIDSEKILYYPDAEYETVEIRISYTADYLQ